MVLIHKDDVRYEINKKVLASWMIPVYDEKNDIFYLTDAGGSFKGPCRFPNQANNSNQLEPHLNQVCLSIGPSELWYQGSLTKTNSQI